MTQGKPQDIESMRPIANPGFVISWLLIGSFFALSFQFLLVRINGQGQWPWLLHCAESKASRELISDQLGPLGPGTEYGHDGEYFYLIARDPFGHHQSPQLLIDSKENPRYRYRRILYPLLAGGFGWFSPWLTLCAMIFLSVLGFGLTMGAAADLADQFGRDSRALLRSLVSPGVMSSVGILLADPLALGFALSGYACYCRKRTAAASILFTAGVLTRETMILFVLSAMLVSIRRKDIGSALKIGLLSSIILVAWEIWLNANIPNGPNALAKNMGLPFEGIFDTVFGWVSGHEAILFSDVLMTLFGASYVLIALRIAWRSERPEISFPLAIWALFTACLSIEVWGKAINGLRVSAPLWILTMLSFDRSITDGESKFPKSTNSTNQDRP